MHKSAIVVLGFTNDQDGRLSSTAIERCEQAIAEHKKRPDAYMLPTGGWGAHFNTTEKAHGYYLKQFFRSRGVSNRQILECAESASTIEDAALARAIVERHAISELIVVTSDFHIPRVEFLFGQEFPDVALTYSSAKTYLPEADLVQRKQHEERALAWLRAEQASGQKPPACPNSGEE